MKRSPNNSIHSIHSFLSIRSILFYMAISLHTQERKNESDSFPERNFSRRNEYNLNDQLLILIIIHSLLLYMEYKERKNESAIRSGLFKNESFDLVFSRMNPWQEVEKNFKK